jgi:hypothetical protein
MTASVRGRPQIRTQGGADLSDADLRGAKLVAAKLVGAKLPRAHEPDRRNRLALAGQDPKQGFVRRLIRHASILNKI